MLVLLCFGGDIEHRFSPKEEAACLSRRSPGEREVVMKLRLAWTSRTREVLRPALGVEARLDGYGLDERRRSGAVLTDEEGDLGVKF